jgi:hypothetical protein
MSLLPAASIFYHKIKTITREMEVECKGTSNYFGGMEGKKVRLG